MELNSKNLTKKSKKSTISIVMYVIAALVLLVGIAALVNNIIIFNNAIAQYVAQGFPADVVKKELIPNQLLPEIFKFALYCGSAFILLGIGILNNKVSKCLMQLDNSSACCETPVDSSVEQISFDLDKEEENQSTEASEEVKE